MMKWILACVAGLLALGGYAQEMILPATINTQLTKDQLKSQTWSATTKSDVSIELPFVDDFSSDRFPGNEEGRQVLWENRTASRNFGWSLNPPTLGVVSFDGADEFGYPYDWANGNGPADTLTSCPINLEMDVDDGAGISFYFQAKGMAYNGPGASDSLILEFYDPEFDYWFWAWSTIDVALDSTFEFVYVPINQLRYLKDGFQFRFRNIAPLQGALGTWNVDYVWVDQNEVNATPILNDVAFVDHHSTLFNRLTAIPRDHVAVNPSALMMPDDTVVYRNLDDSPKTLVGNKIRLIDPETGAVLGDFPNNAEPPIQAESIRVYSHTIGDSPNNIEYDPAWSDTDMSVRVEFIHSVAGFSATASNDTMNFVQSMFTHYAYDDGHAEAAYAIASAGGEVALRYDNLKGDSIFALQIYTMPLGYDHENSSFTIKVWEDDEGSPGSVLGETQKTLIYGLDSYQDMVVYVFEEPVFVPEGSFFVGYQQSSQFEGVRVGLDFNTAGNDGNLFRREGPNWSPTSPLFRDKTVMIRPMFTSNGYEDVIASTDVLDISNQLKVYPNPANDLVNLSTDLRQMLDVRVYDLTGRMVDQTRFASRAALDISKYQNGIYLLRFTDEAGGQGVKKLVVNH